VRRVTRTLVSFSDFLWSSLLFLRAVVDEQLPSSPRISFVREIAGFSSVFVDAGHDCLPFFRSKTSSPLTSYTSQAVLSLVLLRYSPFPSNASSAFFLWSYKYAASYQSIPSPLVRTYGNSRVFPFLLTFPFFRSETEVFKGPSR